MSASDTTTTANAATTTPSGSGITIDTKHGTIGTILAAGPKLMTVYLRESDTGRASACTGACARAWPLVTTTGAPKAAGAVGSEILGAITLTDGAKQVTYRGHPLYYFAKDRNYGDVRGQNLKAFGAEWHILTPIGNGSTATIPKGATLPGG